MLVISIVALQVWVPDDFCWAKDGRRGGGGDFLNTLNWEERKSI